MHISYRGNEMYKLDKEKKCIKVAIAIYDEKGDKFLTQHSHLALSDKTINKIYKEIQDGKKV